MQPNRSLIDSIGVRHVSRVILPPAPRTVKLKTLGWNQHPPTCPCRLWVRPLCRVCVSVCAGPGSWDPPTPRDARPPTAEPPGAPARPTQSPSSRIGIAKK